MKKFGKMLGKAFVFCIVMIVLCSFVYPLALTGVSQLTMKNNANGNLIDKNGEPTNNIEEALYLADRIVLLSNCPAHVKEIYDIDLPRPPQYDRSQIPSIEKDYQ